MPIYCYKCFNCDHYEEIKQKFDDEELTVCPECGEEQFKRVIRNVGIIFKGKGFHVTDYGGNKASAPAPSTPEPSSAPKAESSDSGDKKPSAPGAQAPAKSGE